MIKVCGVLKNASVKEVGGYQIVKLQVVDPAGGDYAPIHYVDDWACRNWAEIKGQQVEIPVRMEPNGKFLNCRVLDSVDPKKCLVSSVKAAA